MRKAFVPHWRKLMTLYFAIVAFISVIINPILKNTTFGVLALKTLNKQLTKLNSLKQFDDLGNKFY